MSHAGCGPAQRRRASGGAGRSRPALHPVVPVAARVGPREGPRGAARAHRPRLALALRRPAPGAVQRHLRPLRGAPLPPEHQPQPAGQRGRRGVSPPRAAEPAGPPAPGRAAAGAALGVGLHGVAQPHPRPRAPGRRLQLGAQLPAGLGHLRALRPAGAPRGARPAAAGQERDGSLGGQQPPGAAAARAAVPAAGAPPAGGRVRPRQRAAALCQLPAAHRGPVPLLPGFRELAAPRLHHREVLAQRSGRRHRPRGAGAPEGHLRGLRARRRLRARGRLRHGPRAGLVPGGHEREPLSALLCLAGPAPRAAVWGLARALLCRLHPLPPPAARPGLPGPRGLVPGLSPGCRRRQRGVAGRWRCGWKAGC